MMISQRSLWSWCKRDDSVARVRCLLPRKAANGSFGLFLSTDYAKPRLAKARARAARRRSKYGTGVMPGEYAIAPMHIL
jgi:hypothetical protein